MLGNGSIRRPKALGLARSFQPLPTTLALACRTMCALTPVMEIPPVAMFNARPHLPLRGTVAFELIGHEDPGHIRQAFEELPEDLLRGPRDTPTLYKDIQDIVVLIHGASQVQVQEY
jgi:hypothetical protein